MHVRHVVRQFHPAVGGLEEVVANLTLSLKQIPGVETSVVTLDRDFSAPDAALPHEDNFHGIGVTRIPFRGSTRYPLAPRVLRALEGADIVHVHAIDFFFDFLALTRPVHGKPLVASTHGGFFHTAFAERLKRVYFNTATRASASAYARIIGSSHNDAAVFARIAPRRTMAIENGVDIAKWSAAGSPSPTRTMVSIGRYSINKNLFALFGLLAELVRLDPAWRLRVIGRDSDLTTAKLREAAAAAGVGDQVEIVTGAAAPQVRELLGDASYFASASTYEGFGLSAIEALSAGLTPLLSPIPPFARLVEEIGQGLLLPFDDPAGAASRIEAHHRAQAGDHAAVRARNMAAAEAYGWPQTAARFAAVYREVLDGSVA